VPIPSALQSRIVELAEDHTSGATVLAKQAATTVLQLTDPQLEIPDAEFPDSCREVALALVRSQPTMAPLLTFCNHVLLAVRNARQGGELREKIRSLAGSVVSQLDTSTTRIALHAEALIQSGTTVLTHSHSTAVKKAFLKAREAGRDFSVICTESRPMFEGLELARELAAHGIPVTLIADAAAYSVMNEAEIVMVGADSVSQGGVVNKIGTSGLGMAARSRQRPFCVLCGSEKFIPDRFVLIEQTKAIEELLPSPVPNIRVRNVYFDTTPLDHLTNLVNEEGIQTVPELRQLLSRLEKDFVLQPEDLRPPS
jgi:translation initiation factor 2B subunit (eIF-2B alpha/beta/delta family)